MNRSASRSGVAALAAVALLIVLAVLASGVLGRSGGPGVSDPPASEAPSEAPVGTPVPSDEPSDEPSQAPTPAPIDGDFGFDLDIATPHDVSVIVDDETDSVTGGKSGQAGDGMSVRWFDSLVENTDADSLRITWVGLPQDDTVRITVSEVDGEIAIHIDQKAPPADSDALGHDRLIELDFDGPVSADDVTVTVSN